MIKSNRLQKLFSNHNYIIRRNKSSLPEETIIFDKKIIICYNCKHLAFDKYKCRKFANYDLINGKYDFINGKYEHLRAEMCRQDETKCGESAVFYEKLSKNDLNNKQITFVFCNFILPVGIVTIVVMTFILPVGIFTIVVMTFNNVFY